MKKISVITMSLLLFAALSTSEAQIPEQINYQGRIQVQGTNMTGTGYFKFAIGDAGMGTAYWSNDGTLIGEPAAGVEGTLDKGLFSVGLGDTNITGMSALDPSVLENDDLWIRVWFSDGVLGYEQISPDKKLSSVPYALHAGEVLDISDHDVTELDDVIDAGSGSIITASERTQIGTNQGNISTLQSGLATETSNRAAADLLIAGQMVAASNALSTRITQNETDIEVNTSSITSIEYQVSNLETAKVSKAGDTMTGALNIHVPVADGGIVIGSTGTTIAIGTDADGSGHGLAIGRYASGSGYGAALGYYAAGSDRGVAQGYSAKGGWYGSAIGSQANGVLYGSAMGSSANGSTYGAALGHRASGFSGGVALGHSANAIDSGVAIGSYAQGRGTNIAIGVEAVALGSRRIAIGQSIINAVDDSAAIRGSLYLDGGTAVYYRATVGSGAWTDLLGEAATGTPVYVETDPVWISEKAGYATGTPMYAYTETDPVWVSERAGYATGTPLYVEADASTNNELNTSVVLNGTDLEVADAGGTLSADLSGLIDDGDWVVSGSNLYNTNSTAIGIGTTNPAANLEIQGEVLISGADNDGTTNYPISVVDEDGYETLRIRSSLSPGASFGSNAAVASFGGIVEAKGFIGGEYNHIDEGADYCFIAGGTNNQIRNSYSDFSSIGGGKDNTIGQNYSSPYSVIGGGRSNIVDNDYSVIAGGRLNYIKRLYSFIGGGRYNRCMDDSSVIVGGRDHQTREYSEYSFIGGGYRHTIRSYNPSDKYNTIVGGFINVISNGYDGFIGGGSWNRIHYGPFSTIAGGQRNVSYEKGTTISGGRENSIVGEYCTIGGGRTNTIDGYSYYSTIPGGTSNRIYASNYGFAAGRNARIWHNGCFAWADGTSNAVNTTAENQFIARSSGGFMFYTAVNGTTTGAQLPAGSGSWSSLSDRNAKENIREINGREVLERLAAIPICTWNYKAQEDQIRHAGPMAQDFYAAYGLGEDQRRLSNVDVDGIALAAIKELKAQKDAEINELKDRIEILIQRIEKIEPGL